MITERRVWEGKEQWPHSASALDQWYRLIKRNSPGDFAQMKALFPATDKVGSLHVFNIGGNKLRLIAVVQYKVQRLYIKQVLDHREYDKGKWKEGRR
ncbi:mRNA interferase HigB [Pseudomonas sp. ok272]|nr:mRNA interferase HigB [Pseudomonas sp. ok272]SFM78327.1 mRNA interferase HigB [Pseudomonas sp. ok602]